MSSKRLILEASQVLTCPGGTAARRGKSMSSIGLIENAAVAVADGHIEMVGAREGLRERFPGPAPE